MICLWEFPSNHVWNILKSARCSKDTGNYSGVILSRWTSLHPLPPPLPSTHTLYRIRERERRWSNWIIVLKRIKRSGFRSLFTFYQICPILAIPRSLKCSVGSAHQPPSEPWGVTGQRATGQCYESLPSAEDTSARHYTSSKSRSDSVEHGSVCEENSAAIASRNAFVAGLTRHWKMTSSVKAPANRNSSSVITQ